MEREGLVLDRDEVEVLTLEDDDDVDLMLSGSDWWSDEEEDGAQPPPRPYTGEEEDAAFVRSGSDGTEETEDEVTDPPPRPGDDGSTPIGGDAPPEVSAPDGRRAHPGGHMVLDCSHACLDRIVAGARARGVPLTQAQEEALQRRQHPNAVDSGDDRCRPCDDPHSSEIVVPRCQRRM